MRERGASLISDRTPFVGRSEEIRWAHRALESARAGQPKVVLVLGEAGVGKSRLLAELCSHARAAGVRVLSASGEEGLVLPYRLLAEALRPALSDGHPDGTSSGDALWMLSGAHRPAESTRSDRALAAQDSDPELWQAILSLEAAFVTLCRRQPLLLSLDDLHWSDGSSLEMLRRLVHASAEAARAAPLPVLFVCSSRPLAGDPGRADLLERLQREEGVSTIELGGLTEDAVAQLLDARGLPSRQITAAVHDLTRGNALFVQEVCRHLKREGLPLDSVDRMMQVDEIPVPSSITAALDARLGALSKEVRRLLAVGACLGERFSLETLSVVTGSPASVLVDSLEEARVEGILAAEGALLAFTHPLLRHSLYRGSGDLLRQRRHQEIADALSERAGGDHKANALEIAHHLICSGALADRNRVLSVAREAGDRALAVWAPGEAARYYEAALEATPPDLEPRQRAELHFAAGVAWYRKADAARAREHFSRAARAYEAIEDAAGVARAELEHMRVQITLDPLPYGSLAKLEPLEKALAKLPVEASRLRGQILSILSGVHWTARQPERAGPRAREALHVARHIRDPRLECEARSALSLTCTQTLELDAAIESSLAAVGAAQQAGDAWLEGTARARLPSIFFCLGRLEQAEASALEAEECSRRTQDWAGLSLAISARVSIEAARGKLEAARELAAELPRLAVRSGYPWGAFGGLRALAGAAFDHGESEEATEALDLIDRPGGIFQEPGVTSLVIWVYRQRMRTRAADPELAKTLASILATQDVGSPPEIGAVSSFCLVIEIARALGEPDLAQHPRRALELAYERGARLSSGWVHVLSRAIGIAAQLASEEDEAERWFRDAERVATESGARVELARTYLDHGHLLQDRGDGRGAHRLALRALEHFSDLGTNGLQRRAKGLAEATSSATAVSQRIEEEDARRLRAIAWSQTDPSPGEPAVLGRWLHEFLAGLDGEAGSHSREPDEKGQSVVILMTDMVNSTARMQRLGEDRALEVLRSHDAILRGCLEAAGGVEMQHTGDGLFARFERADQAIHCAAQMQEALERFNRDEQESVQVRIGIAEGRVLPIEGRVFGSAVNLAARLCASAGPERIVVSRSVREHAQPSPPLRALGAFEFKGFPDPVQVHEVVWKRREP